MIDLHNHILPGIDDGCKTLEESLALARAYVDYGFTAISTTSHIRPGLFDNNEDDIRGAVLQFRQSLEEQRIPLDVHAGAEYFFSDSFVAKVETPSQLLTLGDTGRYVLVEFSSIGRPSSLRDLVFRLQVHGVTPIIAHPERYSFVAEDLSFVEELVEAGILLQGTLSCLEGFWPSNARKTFKRLLDAGLLHLVSSDIHSAANAKALLSEGVKRLKTMLGTSKAEDLLEHNPKKILEGRDL